MLEKPLSILYTYTSPIRLKLFENVSSVLELFTNDLLEKKMHVDFTVPLLEIWKRFYNLPVEKLLKLGKTIQTYTNIYRTNYFDIRLPKFSKGEGR